MSNVRLTRRGNVVLGVAAISLWATGIGVAFTHSISVDSETGRPTPVAGSHNNSGPRPLVSTNNIVVYEDGSGVQYINGRVVREFPEDTFGWNCATMGNHICGPVAQPDPQPSNWLNAYLAPYALSGDIYPTDDDGGR